MLGRIKTAINNYIKRVVAQDTAAKEKEAPKKQQRDFGADISSITIQKKDINELLRLSFQKTAKDFTVNYNGKKQVAMDSAECQMAAPAVDMSGTSKDILYTFFSKFGFIGWQQCALLAQHWLISNACSIPAKDAIRNGWINTFADANKETSGEDKEKEQKFLNELNETTNNKFKLSEKAIQWITKYNIFGIGIALPKIDGIEYDKPYNPDGIKKGSFKGITIMDPYWLTPQFDEETMVDPTNPNFYKPTHYLTAKGDKIHASHFIIIRRKEVPDILKPSYYFGGIPLTQEIYERVYAAEKSANEQPLLLLTKRLNGWKVDLQAFFTNPKEYEARIRNFTDKRDNQGVLLIDHEDDMFQIDTTLSDLDQVVMSQYKLVAAVARIPVDKLFELNPSGALSNSGDFNIKNYTQDLNTIQNDLYKPFIDRINEIVMRSYYGRKDKIAIIFNPTDNPTAAEQATNVKTEVDTLQSLIGNNVITTEEARQKLISDKRNGFSFLDEEAPEQEQDNEEIAQMMKEQQNKQQGKDTAEDTDWITVHPHGNKEAKGQPVPVEEGQGKGEAIKQHFARAAAGETNIYNNNDDDDFDDSFNPEVIEEQEELEKKDKELQKEQKKEASKAKREQKKWESMSEEEREQEREQFNEAEEEQSKERNKEKQNHTLVHEKQILEDMGIGRIKKPTPEDKIYKEYNDLSPRIKRYFFTDNKNALKWDEAQQILQEHKGNDTEDIFEYLRVVDLKTPQSRTNERTRNYLKGTSEDEWDENKVNRTAEGKFAPKGTAETKENENKENSQKEINFENEIQNAFEKVLLLPTVTLSKETESYNDALDKLNKLAGQELTNEENNIKAFVNSNQKGKLISNKAVNKSIANGFTREEHYAVASEIDKLFKKATMTFNGGDRDEKLKSVKRFVACFNKGQEKAYACMLLKENMEGDKRIYTVELQELKKVKDYIKEIYDREKKRLEDTMGSTRN